MSEEKKLEESLAAWVPPWQRVTQTPAEPAADEPNAGDAAAADDADDADDVDLGDDEDVVDDEDAVDAQLPVTDAAGLPGEPDEYDGEIVDTLEDLAFAGRVPQAETDDEDVEEDDADEQLPETDVLDDAAGGDDEDEQRPETDVLAEPVAGSAEGDGGDDDIARPETDFGRFAYPPTKAGAEEADQGNRPDDLRGAIEAILLVVDEPVTDDVLASVLSVTAAEVTEELTALAAEYSDTKRGFELRRAAGGWRLYTRGEFSPYVERFVLDGQSVRLTQAALETLAVVAYQQPVTRSRMAAIRGVNCDGVVRTLVSRGLIEECGTQPESGAFLYQTTQLFLEKLGLDSLDQLPALAPFLPDDVNGLVDAER